MPWVQSPTLKKQKQTNKKTLLILDEGFAPPAGHIYFAHTRELYCVLF
jgi:hypothetical protein